MDHCNDLEITRLHLAPLRRARSRAPTERAPTSPQPLRSHPRRSRVILAHLVVFHRSLQKKNEDRWHARDWSANGRAARTAARPTYGASSGYAIDAAEAGAAGANPPPLDTWSACDRRRGRWRTDASDAAARLPRWPDDHGPAACDASSSYCSYNNECYYSSKCIYRYNASITNS